MSCGDSSKTDIGNESVDLVITDPPFFDNVHYSQLADFFYVWLRHIFRQNDYPTTTRLPQEVQDTNTAEFTRKLTDVFKESYRVLKQDGLFVFTYHHSRIEGWVALYKAIRESGFYVVHTHPVKSEMSVAISIQQSKSPINFDLIIVCRKNIPNKNLPLEHDSVPLLVCLGEAQNIVKELKNVSIQVSTSDAKVILLGCMLSKLSLLGDLSQEIEFLQNIEPEVNVFASEIMK